MSRIESLPDLESIKRGIDELLLIEKWDRFKVKSSPKKFEKRFRELFTSKVGVIPHVVQQVDSNLFSFKFFRLRKETKSMNENIISEYSYPPNHVVKTIQRANIPYHPVFYCSNNPLTAIYETVKSESKLNTETFYYLSEWQLRPNVQLKICPFLFGNLDASNPFKLYSDSSYEKIKKLMLKDHSDTEVEGLIKILEFLSHLFVYDNTYIVSSYIAHSNLYANHSLRPDVFIYPSIQTDKKTVNFAVHPNSVTQKLLLEKVYKLRVTDLNVDNGSCQVQVFSIAENKDGILYWKQPDKKQFNELLNRHNS